MGKSEDVNQVESLRFKFLKWQPVKCSWVVDDDDDVVCFSRLKHLGFY